MLSQGGGTLVDDKVVVEFEHDEDITVPLDLLPKPRDISSKQLKDGVSLNMERKFVGKIWMKTYRLKIYLNFQTR